MFYGFRRQVYDIVGTGPSHRLVILRDDIINILDVRDAIGAIHTVIGAVLSELSLIHI